MTIKGATDGPRISQDYSNMGTKGGEEAKSTEKLTLPQLNGILDELGLGTLGGATEPMVKKGKAEDKPRQDGPVRSRSEGIKSFFQKVGEGIGSFFSKIGNAFGTAFEAIKEAVTSRLGGAQPANNAPTPLPLDKSGIYLKDFCQELGKVLETNYQTYLTTTQDDPPMSRSEFVKREMPDPPGGRDGIDQNSPSYVGDSLPLVRAHMTDAAEPGQNEMQKAIMARFEEMPTVEIAAEGLFKHELAALESDPTTFLRGNTAFTKLDKFLGSRSIPFQSVADDILATIRGDVEKSVALAKNLDGSRIAASTFSQQQGELVHQLADKVLTAMLDTDFTNPKSLLNQMSDDYRKFLSDKAETIMNLQDVSLEDRQGAVKMLYSNSLFLRGINTDLALTSGKISNQDIRNIAVQTSQLAQSFLNGVTELTSGKGNDVAQSMLENLIKTHQPRLEAFLTAVGMPVFAETETTEDLKSDTAVSSSDQPTSSSILEEEKSIGESQSTTETRDPGLEPPIEEKSSDTSLENPTETATETKDTANTGDDNAKP